MPQFHQQLLDEQELLSQQENDHEQLSNAVNTHYQQALAIAKRLHQERQYYANELAALITESMHELSMPHGKFAIETIFEPEHLSAEGAT